MGIVQAKTPVKHITIEIIGMYAKPTNYDSRRMVLLVVVSNKDDSEESCTVQT
jgi:hypothetical protein